MLNILNTLQVKRDDLLKSGLISPNGSLDFPPEILITIFKESEWNLGLRNSNKYLLGVYDTYGQFNIVIKTSTDLNIFWKKYSHINCLINIKSFFPNNLERISSLKLGSDAQYLHISADLIALFSMLEKNTSLTTLDLGGISTGPRDTIFLAKVLEKNRTLTTLILCGNNIQNLGAQKIAEVLEKNNTLKFLDLSFNKIDDDGAIVLAKALETNTTLLSLDLSWNEIGYKGANALLRVLDIEIGRPESKIVKTNKTLRFFDFTHNQFGFAADIMLDRVLTLRKLFFGKENQN